VCVLYGQVLQGLPNVRKVYTRSIANSIDWSQESGCRRSDIVILDTEGTELRSTLSFPGVDISRTSSNDVLEIAAVRMLDGHFVIFFSAVFALTSFL
jgi:hypothetical protein